MQALRQRFHQGLPARMERLLAANDAPTRHSVLHSLAGAAGLHGDTALEACARAALAQTDLDPQAAAWVDALSKLQAEVLALSR